MGRAAPLPHLRVGLYQALPALLCGLTKDRRNRVEPKPKVVRGLSPGTCVLVGLAWLWVSAAVQAMDAAAADQLLKDNKCTKCHDVERKKDGPAYRDVAAKYRTEPGGQDKVMQHMTAGDRVKFPDGHEERHKKIKADNPEDVKALAVWMLSLDGGKK
jgi:cytochrome c